MRRIGFTWILQRTLWLDPNADIKQPPIGDARSTADYVRYLPGASVADGDEPREEDRAVLSLSTRLDAMRSRALHLGK